MKHSLPLLILVSLQLFFAQTCWSSSPKESFDRFSNFEELSRHYKEGRDFKILIKRRKSPILVAAIHGGTIEPGTEELAKIVAGNKHSLYLFSSKLPKNKGWDLHLTSTHFDEPTALAFVKEHQSCVTIHSFWTLGKEEQEGPQYVLLGGRNQRLREELRSQLIQFRDAYYPELIIQDGRGHLSGMARKNFVNLPEAGGVQLEFSRSFLSKIQKSKNNLNTLGKILRKTISKEATLLSCSSLLSTNNP